MFGDFIRYVSDHEEWLMGRILDYALKRGYTKYTSTLKEAWRLSISGLSESLVKVVQARGGDLELSPEEDYTRDHATQFGIVEARRHRERGVSLDMFLGLMKYYRQSYVDLILESDFVLPEKRRYSTLINRFFDRVEIGFCTTWASSKEDQRVQELQVHNRLMTNEKNKYLTIFESLSIPVFIVDRDGRIENMNHSASHILNHGTVPGAKYYKDEKEVLYFTREFPWLSGIYEAFVTGNEPRVVCERSPADQDRFFYVSCSRSLDITGKFSGTVVIIEDITARKKMERELEMLATTDPLTGAKNRRSFLQAFEQELARSRRYGHSLGLLLMDIDYFKTINDIYGHDAGDRVLKLLVAESQVMLRDSDLFGRWGGEEFIVLLPEADTRKASFVAEKLRSHLAGLELAVDSGTAVTFTVSIGLTVAGGKQAMVEEMVKKADAALYQAKRQGRNRVVASNS